MRLVLQCSSCGTVHTVGTAACGTCRSSGLQHLRLLFECQECFGLGLNPTCPVCSPVLLLDAAGGPTDSAGSINGAARAHSGGDTRAAEPLLEPAADHLAPGPIHRPVEDSDFELSLDDLPFAEDDREGLTLDDEADSAARDES